MGDFFKQNAIQILVLMAALIGGYAEYELLKMRVEIIERRLDKKIKIINQHDQRLYKLEKDV